MHAANWRVRVSNRFLAFLWRATLKRIGKFCHEPILFFLQFFLVELGRRTLIGATASGGAARRTLAPITVAWTAIELIGVELVRTLKNQFLDFSPEGL